ncbi:MAG: hypothetical protein KAT05_09600, partial [Spirochaetes bacterium]|nr:hypothetical protein [Spirochaetota bacterium]
MENIYTNFDFFKLEFDKILNDISNYTLSEKGKEVILNSVPEKDIEKIIYLHNILNQFKKYFVSEESLQISIIYNFNKQLEDAKKNIILDAIALYKLAFSVQLYFTISKKFKKPQYPDLFKLFSINKIEDNFYLDVLKYIEPNGYIDSNATNILKKVRINIDEIKDKIKRETNNFYKEVKKLNYTSDDIISIRDGFSCVAIKSKFKNRVDGIVLDISASGQTVFIVPKRVIQLHNDFVVLLEEEKKEINQILQNYTDQVNENIESLKIINEELIDFDVFYSKTRYSLAYNLNSPEIIDDKKISSKKFIKILDGIHPLLGKDAVPLNIEIGKNFKILIITGPNTGGKTVILKTIGLFILMVQSGIAIPASSTSQFCIFDKLFIDIGDEQSIEQSLSTFSAHIKKIIEIINNADSNSLILIDELGAGTDPIEGSALAISILQTFLKLKSIAVITTHYSALKHIAAQQEGIENGSMEFDSINLIPTYILQIGIPGSSKAFEISKRLGMPDQIIEIAKSNINKDFLDIEKIIEKLEKEKKQLELKKELLLKKEDEFKNIELSFLEEKAILEKKETELKQLLKNKES